jgi:hypothetical protein
LYGNFIIDICAVAFVVMLIGVNNLRINRKNTADMEEAINLVMYYLESATKDDQREIGKKRISIFLFLLQICNSVN